MAWLYCSGNVRQYPGQEDQHPGHFPGPRQELGAGQSLPGHLPVGEILNLSRGQLVQCSLLQAITQYDPVLEEKTLEYRYSVLQDQVYDSLT